MTKIASIANRSVLRSMLLAGAPTLLVVALALFASKEANPAGVSREPPPTLAETGLYANAASLEVDAKHLAFAPQYPLWTDGAEKRRWLSLPPGTVIDATDPNAWVFPVGTRFWKEFSFNGTRIETRFMERQADGTWRYAAYAWSADGRDAQLVSEQGKRGAYPLGGKRAHAIPSIEDCKACHQGGSAEILGFTALQLSHERDPGALHAESRPASGVDLKFLIENRLIVGLPESFIENPPRIVADTPTERAALGYVHGNCGHCHNGEGPLRNVGLFLRYVEGAKIPPAVATTVEHPVKKPAPGLSPDAVTRIEPQHPERSALMQRMSSRYPALQMPPLGTALVDKESVELIRRWITEGSLYRNPSPTEAKGYQQ